MVRTLLSLPRALGSGELKSHKPFHVAEKKEKESPLTAPSLLHKNNYYHPICVYCLRLFNDLFYTGINNFIYVSDFSRL